MYEITINMSWFPAWMLWAAGGAAYVGIGIVLSCLFKAREEQQKFYLDQGCGRQCCPGTRCGEIVVVSYSERHHHRCSGDMLTTNHKFSSEACEVAKCASLIIWPIVLVIGAFGQLACVIRDLWWHSGQYGLRKVKRELLKRQGQQGTIA